jgi:hypothetical protein
MNKQLSRVIREYVLWTDAGYSVKGRVSEILDSSGGSTYQWEVSHHYKPSATAMGVYYPSVTRGKTLEEVEALMLTYLNGFTGIDVEVSKSY